MVAVKAHNNIFSRLIRGFTMIELLIAIVILAIGLLGLAGIQTQAQKRGLEAYQRQQALIILYDIVDRMQANPYSAACYAYTIDNAAGTPFLGDAGANHLGAPICVGIGSTATQTLAIADMTEWDSILQGISERDNNGNNIGSMIGARGCISADVSTTPVTYTVAVSWQGTFETTTPAVNCANGLYGDERLRRIVSTTVQLGDLN